MAKDHTSREITTQQLRLFRDTLKRGGATREDLDSFQDEFVRIVEEGRSIDTGVDNLMARLQLIIARRNQKFKDELENDGESQGDSDDSDEKDPFDPDSP